jgi:hypothetical protein
MRTAQHVLFVLVTATMLAPMLLTNSIQAQEDERCFPETGQCISGRFREFWEQNSGLAVFGYPITPAGQNTDPTIPAPDLIQWSERARLELHPENDAPYDVQLGRLGDTRLSQQSRNWWLAFPKANPNTANYFAETGQAIAPEFIGYWRANRLELGDPGVSFRESLGLFGSPFSPAQIETNANGENVLTQIYERARVELPILSNGSETSSASCIRLTRTICC